jgi:hypothetical protein
VNAKEGLMQSMSVPAVEVPEGQNGVAPLTKGLEGGKMSSISSPEEVVDAENRLIQTMSVPPVEVPMAHDQAKVVTLTKGWNATSTSTPPVVLTSSGVQAYETFMVIICATVMMIVLGM